MVMATYKIKDQFHAELLPGSTSITGFSASQIWKRGNVVTITLMNANNLSVGDNIILTLPEGWRPQWNSLATFDAPNAPTQRFRIMVYNDGRVNVHNYSSSAITGDTNAGITLTFAAVN